jgi:hypothetical protein
MFIVTDDEAINIAPWRGADGCRLDARDFGFF